MESPKYKIIAIMSGILSILAFSHFILGVYITKETEHLTFIWIFLALTAQSLLGLYGTLNNSYSIYLPAIFTVMGIIYILYVKVNNSVDNNVKARFKMKNII